MHTRTATRASASFGRWPRVPVDSLAVDPYLPLVRSIVADVARHADLDDLGINAHDLAGYGTVGLLQAALRFDPARGVAFSTFATRRIRGAMLDAIRAGARWRRDVNWIASDTEQLAADANSLDAHVDAACRVVGAMRRLPPCDSALVVGHFLDGLSCAELGDHIERSPSQVCRRLAGAVARLRTSAVDGAVECRAG